MSGVKGIFVCNQDHKSNDHHEKGEVKMAINRLKEKRSTEFLSRVYHYYVGSMYVGPGHMSNSYGDHEIQ